MGAAERLPSLRILVAPTDHMGTSEQMLWELGRKDWLGILGLRPEQAPPVLTPIGTRNLTTRDAESRAHPTEVVGAGSPNGLFEDVLIGRLDGAPISHAAALRIVGRLVQRLAA